MALNTYDCGKVSVTFGPDPISGFAPDSLVSAEREVDSWTKQGGADGEVTRSRQRNKSGSVTITLAQGSASNDLLSAIAIADEADGSGSYPLQIKDGSGTTLVTAENAWIRKIPKVDLGREAGTREWVLDCDELIVFVGGNA